MNMNYHLDFNLIMRQNVYVHHLCYAIAIYTQPAVFYPLTTFR